MVEGSKIDWAAHCTNDAKTDTVISCLDRLSGGNDFAHNDGQTLVMILPDHGNSGITIGNRNSNKGYDELPCNNYGTAFPNQGCPPYQMTEILKNVLPKLLILCLTEFRNHTFQTQRKEIIAAVQRDKNNNYSAESNKTKLSTKRNNYQNPL
jgi:alkaline phosphatase